MDNGIAVQWCKARGAEWYFPSCQELNLIYTNLFLKGHGGFDDGFYWTSSESEDIYANIQYFLNGAFFRGNKNGTHIVLAIRDF